MGLDKAVCSVCGVSFTTTDRHGRGASIITFPRRYCVVDIETTGFSPSWDEIIEVAAIRYIDGVEDGRFQSLIQPKHRADGTYVEAHIEKLTGITNEMLADAPQAVDVLPRFLTFVGDDLVLGYNVSFDVNFLYDKCECLLEQIFSNDFIDIMRLAKRLCPDLQRFRLKDVAALYGVEVIQAHRALADCETTERVYQRLCDEIRAKYGDLEHFILNYDYYRANTGEGKPLSMNVDESKVGPDCPIYQRHFVITGTLDRFTRAQAMQLIEDLGGINDKTVNRRTNYLILGNNDYCATIRDGKSTKQKKAEAMMLEGQDIEIIPESVFYDMIGEYIAEAEPAVDEEEKVAEHFTTVILNTDPSAKISLEDRSDNYHSLCVNGVDILRYKYTDKTRWISIDSWNAGIYPDDPRFTAHENKAQRHWKTKIDCLDDLSKFDDLIAAATTKIAKR